MKKTIVATSGGFDPIHVGHLRLLKEARALGDKLVVILNNDNWLRKKKGYAFMPQEERAAVLEALRYVDRVVITGHKKNAKDMSVQKELAKIRPDIFANGGDRDKKDARNRSSSLNADQLLCQKLGIRMVFNVGGNKAQSSSWLVEKVQKAKRKKT